MNVGCLQNKTHIWRIKTLHPYTSVEHVSFCPSLIPVALHPPWFGLPVFYLRNFIDLFFYCPPIKVVELLKVIKESSSRPALISGCKKGFIEEKADSETLNATRKITGESTWAWTHKTSEQSPLRSQQQPPPLLFSFELRVLRIPGTQ